MNLGQDFMGFDRWQCEKCGLRWRDKVAFRISHSRCDVLRFYVTKDSDGFTVCPTELSKYTPKGKPVRGPDGRRRVFVGLGFGPNEPLEKRFAALNGVQVRALANIALRMGDSDPDVRPYVPAPTRQARELVFYDANVWARSRVNRHKVIARVQLP